jgi:hypothetical protein
MLFPMYDIIKMARAEDTPHVDCSILGRHTIIRMAYRAVADPSPLKVTRLQTLDSSIIFASSCNVIVHIVRSQWRRWQ